ncbi:MAG TPA: hypothetical protein VLF68_03270 [Candidatus Saccharimonadales bacterium]|nr:hypothetical protein [Candidatus Saccharimonadales bacterium]
MTRNFLLIISAVLLHLLLVFSLNNITHSISRSGTLSLVFYISSIENNLPILIGVLIGLLGKHNSWRYSFLYGLLITPISAIMLSAFYGPAVKNVEIGMLIYSIILISILATLGSFAGERIKELQK